MKRKLFVTIASLCLAILFAGCAKDARIELTGETGITVGSEAPDGTITFTTNKSWSISSDETWLHFSPSSGAATDQPVTVTVTCDDNPATEPREAVVTITAGDASKTVTVRQTAKNIPVTRIELSQTEAFLKLGETLQLTATVYPDNATDRTVVWTTEFLTKRQGKAATVSDDGLVTTKEIGQVNVVASCGGCEARCLVSVYDDVTVYVYDGLEWGDMRLYGYVEGGIEVVPWPGIQAAGTEELYGNTFYKFILGKDWFLDGLYLVFNDGGDNRTKGYTNDWYYGDSYFVYVTGPYSEEGFATPTNITYLDSFDPQPYTPTPDPNPLVVPEDAIYYVGFPVTCEWFPDWTFIDADGDGYQWGSSYYWGSDLLGHDGAEGVLLSLSYDGWNSLALTPDNWAFTPAIQLSAEDNYLSFWLCAQDASFPLEHYAVYATEAIPESGDIAEQCTILMDGTVTQSHTIYTRVQSSWEHYCIHIPESFNGKQVYFGFRHFNTTDQFIINLDDVLVTPYPYEAD